MNSDRRILVVPRNRSHATAPRGVLVPAHVKAELEQLDRDRDPLYHAELKQAITRRQDGKPLRRQMTRRFAMMTRRERRKMLREMGMGPGNYV